MKYGVIKELQELPDRTTLSRSALDDVYRSMHGQVKKTVVQGPRFCAITYDLWTDSYRRRAYITFTCHLVNRKFFAYAAIYMSTCINTYVREVFMKDNIAVQKSSFVCKSCMGRTFLRFSCKHFWYRVPAFSMHLHMNSQEQP